MAGTTRSGKTTQLQTGANQQQHAFVKLKLTDAQSELQQPQLQLNEGGIGGSSGAPMMFESYQIQASQPISTTNQQKVKKVTAVRGMSLGGKTKSQERNQNHTG